MINMNEYWNASPLRPKSGSNTLLGGVHTWRLFWSCRRLFYIIILWSKPWALFKTPPLASFSAALSVFSSWKKLNFSKKSPTSSAFLLTNDKRVARSVVSITTRKKMEKVPVDRLIVLVSDHKELYDMSCNHKRRCESTFSFPLTSKANARANFLLFLDISAAHSARLLLQLLLWQQKTLSAAICNRRCQLCFSLKKRSCQLFLVKKDTKCEHSLTLHFSFCCLLFDT